jgi:hypothetical protein
MIPARSWYNTVMGDRQRPNHPQHERASTMAPSRRMIAIGLRATSLPIAALGAFCAYFSMMACIGLLRNDDNPSLFLWLVIYFGCPALTLLGAFASLRWLAGRELRKAQ